MYTTLGVLFWNSAIVDRSSEVSTGAAWAVSNTGFASSTCTQHSTAQGIK